jgi:hypothetical protein
MNTDSNRQSEPDRPVSMKAAQKPERLVEPLSLTREMEMRLCRIDKKLIGTENYMGLAWFWSPDFNMLLIHAAPEVRVAAHDAMLAEGLNVREGGIEQACLIGRALGACGDPL